MNRVLRVPSWLTIMATTVMTGIGGFMIGAGVQGAPLLILIWGSVLAAAGLAQTFITARWLR